MAQEIKMSAAGLKAMQEELEYLKTVRRKELAEEIKEARSHVSLSEVSTYSPPSEGFGSRFVSALSAGWQNFVGGLQQVIVALAGAWPVVVIAAAACAGFVVWKKKKK